MNRVSIIWPKIAVRLMIGAAFSTVWYFLNGRERSLNIPLIFFGVIWLAGAWFSYLRCDGLAIFTKRGRLRSSGRRMEDTFDRMLPVHPHEEHLLKEDEPDDSMVAARQNMWANALSGLVLICVSFLF